MIYCVRFYNLMKRTVQLLHFLFTINYHFYILDSFLLLKSEHDNSDVINSNYRPLYRIGVQQESAHNRLRFIYTTPVT